MAETYQNIFFTDFFRWKLSFGQTFS